MYSFTLARNYLFRTLGVSRKKIAKNITISVPIKKNVYTKASINLFFFNLILSN